MNTQSAPYDDRFFSDNEGGSAAAAAVVLGLLYEAIFPKTVLDIGCGVGTWLRAAEDLGATDVLGVDGTYVDRSRLHVSPLRFLATDLADANLLRYTIGERHFDLAMCLEVAEHLPATSARPLVEALGALSDIVLWSAACPGQGGTEHINEQPLAYWVSLFGRIGFVPLDVLRPGLQDSPIDVWYAQNAVLFVRNVEAPRVEKAFRSYYERTMGFVPPLSFLHPTFVSQWAGLKSTLLDETLSSLANRFDAALRLQIDPGETLERLDHRFGDHLGMVAWMRPAPSTTRPTLLMTARQGSVADVGLYCATWTGDLDGIAEVRRIADRAGFRWVPEPGSGVGGWARLVAPDTEPTTISLLGQPAHDSSLRQVARVAGAQWTRYWSVPDDRPSEPPSFDFPAVAGLSQPVFLRRLMDAARSAFRRS